MSWRTYISGRVERLENDLRRLPDTVRGSIDYRASWVGLRDARILAGLPPISPDLSPIWAIDLAAQDSANLPPTGAIAAAPNLDVRAPQQNARVPAEANLPGGPNWWNGDQTERAYAALHRADAAYLALAPSPILRQRAALMLSQLHMCGLASGDIRLNLYTTTLNSVAFPTGEHAPAVSDATRGTLKEISEALDLGKGGQHYWARAYRNELLATAIGLLAIYLLLSLGGSLAPAFFSLCSSGPAGPSCPSGTAPGSGDVFLLGLAGLAGGSIGALPLLINVSGPFTLAMAQALLKLSSGAVISLIGLFVLQHGTLGILMPQSGKALVAWAFAFGISQQAVTRVIDKRVNDSVGGPAIIAKSSRSSDTGKSGGESG